MSETTTQDTRALESGVCMLKDILSALIIVILCSSVGQAIVINVPGDQPTIQAGIDVVASQGLTIEHD